MTFEEMLEAKLAIGEANWNEQSARQLLSEILLDGTDWVNFLPAVVSTMEEFGSDQDKDVAERFNRAVDEHLRLFFKN